MEELIEKLKSQLILKELQISTIECQKTSEMQCEIYVSKTKEVIELMKETIALKEAINHLKTVVK